MFPDVIALKPAAVVILAGTNDISRATGAVDRRRWSKFNLQAMAQLAQANGIKVVLCSILPTDDDTGASRRHADAHGAATGRRCARRSRAARTRKCGRRPTSSS